MHRAELNGLIGWCEAECAVEAMLRKSERLGLPFEKMWVRPDEFSKDELVGFCILLAQGYMRSGYPTGYFWVGKSLVEKMRGIPVFSRMPDPLSFVEMYFKGREEYASAVNKESSCPKA